jgi:hypothetical protein
MDSTTIEKPPAKRAASKRVIPLGNEIDAIWKLREDKRAMDTAVKAVEKEIESLEAALLERLDNEGLDKASGKMGTISIGESLNGTIEDWDAFTAYLAKSKNFQLIQKRISDPAYRELLGMGKPIPGVKPFTKRKLNLRSIAQ